MYNQKQQCQNTSNEPITMQIKRTTSEWVPQRQSIELEDVSSNLPIIQLTLRDSNRASVRQSTVFSDIEHYQKEICFSESIFQDFNQVRQSYRQSIHITQSHHLEHSSELQCSQSCQVQILKHEEQPSLESTFMQLSVATNIQQIGNENSVQIDEPQITVLLILSSKEQIQSVSVVDEKGKQTKIKLSKRKALNNYVVLSLFHMKKSELQNYKIIYTTTTTNIFFFTKVTTHTLDFGKLILEQQAGLLSQDIANQSSDELINSCIILGHQYLIKYLQQLQELNVVIFRLYYKIFKKHFRAYSDKIALVFQSVGVDQCNDIYSEFFLYFIFVIYREGALQVLRQYNLYQKLMFNQSSVGRILSKKHFNYYDNGQYLKQFIVYAIFCYNNTVFSQHVSTYCNIAKMCIAESSALYNRAIFSKVCKVEKKEIMNKLLQNKHINNTFINNPQICFVQYLEAMIAYSQSKVNLLKLKNDVENITNVVLGLLVKLNSKLQIAKLDKQQEQSLSKYEIRFTSLLKSATGQFNLQIKKLGQIYLQVKGLCQCAPKMGQLLMNILKDFIYLNCPALLKYFFNSIIYPLVIFPQVAEENVLLIDFFMKQQIESESIFILIKLSLQNNRLINFQTIEFILKKYMKENPFIHVFNYEELKKKIGEWLASYQISRDRKNFLLKLIEVLQARRGSMVDREGFACCLKQIKDCLYL